MTKYLSFLESLQFLFYVIKKVAFLELFELCLLKIQSMQSYVAANRLSKRIICKAPRTLFCILFGIRLKVCADICWYGAMTEDSGNLILFSIYTREDPVIL